MPAGHFSAKKVYDRLRRHYWWKGMRADVYHFCRKCLVCARAVRLPLVPIPVGAPFHRVGVDVLQFPVTHKGNVCQLLGVIGQFTSTLKQGKRKYAEKIYVVKGLMVVISKVSEPSPWLVVVWFSMHLHGFQTLENVFREVHPIPKVVKALAQLSGAAIFSKLDANSGFSNSLATESRALLTFVTLWTIPLDDTSKIFQHKKKVGMVTRLICCCRTMSHLMKLSTYKLI